MAADFLSRSRTKDVKETEEGSFLAGAELIKRTEKLKKEIARIEEGVKIAQVGIIQGCVRKGD